MGEHKKLYNIVPINDGCTYLCRDENNNFYLQHKIILDPNRLYFDTSEQAQEYILMYLDKTKYKAEWFSIDEDYLEVK